MFGNRPGGRLHEIDRRLRSDAVLARRPAPEAIRGRTIVAIGDLTPEPRPPGKPMVALVPSYLAACCAMVLLGALAIALVASRAEGPPDGAPTQAALTAPAATGPGSAGAKRLRIPPVIEVDASRLAAAVDRQAERFDSPLETALVAQARLVLGDAGRAADLVLARLPMRPLRFSRQGQGPRPEGE